MALVVSDTSPIRAFNHLGLLHVWHTLFNEVWVPPAVVSELLIPRAKIAAIDVATLPWIRVRQPSDGAMVARLLDELDPGEAEAITLAVELDASILTDEADGRAVALRLGLSRIGALGILVRAKSHDLIAEVKPLIGRSQRELDFHVSAAVRAEVLRQAGEAD